MWVLRDNEISAYCLGDLFNIGVLGACTHYVICQPKIELFSLSPVSRTEIP